MSFQSNNRQYTTPYTQINHPHMNHTRHHIHYNNPVVPPLPSKMQPTTLIKPIIIKSKTVKQTTTSISRPFNTTSNHINPTTHPSQPQPQPPSITSTRYSSHPCTTVAVPSHPHAPPNNIHRHLHRRHHRNPYTTPHIITSPNHHRNPSYSNYMHPQYSQRVNTATNTIYTKPNYHTPSGSISPSKTVHFKPPNSNNFVQPSQPPPPPPSTKLLNDNLFGNVIINGEKKAPSPIGLDTLDNHSHHSNSIDDIHVNNTHTQPRPQHAKSHNERVNYSHQQQQHHGRKRKHSECNNNNTSHNRISTHKQYNNKNMNDRIDRIQPPYKKRKINGQNGHYMSSHLQHNRLMGHHKQHLIRPIRKHIHAPHQKVNKSTSANTSAPHRIAMPPMHTGTHMNRTYKLSPKELTTSFPALTQRRYSVDDGHSNHKFVSHTPMNHSHNHKILKQMKPIENIKPIKPMLSVGVIAPALMPMPSINTNINVNDNNNNINNGINLPTPPMSVSDMLTSPNTFNSMHNNQINMSPNMHMNNINISPIHINNSNDMFMDNNNQSPIVSHICTEDLNGKYESENNISNGNEEMEEEMKSNEEYISKSSGIFNDNMEEYNKYTENKCDLYNTMGWDNNDIFTDTLPIFPITFEELHSNNNSNSNNSNNINYKDLSCDIGLKKAALLSLYDINNLELIDPEITQLRLCINNETEDSDNECSEEIIDRNNNYMLSFTGSLIGNISSNKSCHRIIKYYLPHNEYNLTHCMTKRGHDLHKIKIPIQYSNENDNNCNNEINAYNIPYIPIDALSSAIKRNDIISVTEEVSEQSSSTSDENNTGIITDWNKIKSLGITIPSYCLNPNNYTQLQLNDNGCLIEKQIYNGQEIHFFIYVPGADIGGQLRCRGTYPPIIYEITCDCKRICDLCLTDECDCTGIIDLLNDKRQRIWVCNQCKNTFRIGLKKNMRTKQYRIMDGKNNNNKNNIGGGGGGDDDYDIFDDVKPKRNKYKKLKQKKKKKKKKKVLIENKSNVKNKNKCFSENNNPFKPYIYNVRGGDGQYIIRRFESSDLDILNKLDIKMTKKLLGENADPYGKVWLDKLTNNQRTTHHIWRTIACCKLLDINDMKKDDDDDKQIIKKYHMIPYVFGNGNIQYIKKYESQPIAFVMYKHIKNENINKRYGELFWILVDNEHQRKGIASRLIDIMVSEAEREEAISQFRLHVLMHNYGAIKLYKRLAFYKKGVKTNYPVQNSHSYRCIKML